MQSVKKHWNDKKTTLILIIGVFLLSILVGYLGPVQMMELKIRDWMFELRGERDLSHSDIIIVEMSQTADEEIPYKYPWPTYMYAKLIDNLNKAGVKAIGIDIIFDQNDIYDLKNDSLFARSIEEHGNVILAGTLARDIRTTNTGIGLERTRMVLPNSILRASSPNPVGIVNTVNDRDEYVRNYLLYLNGINEIHYSFGLEMLRLVSDIPVSEIGKQENIFKFGPFRIPTFQANTMLTNYYGGAGSFKYLGFEEIIDDRDFETITEREAFEMNLFDDPEYGILHKEILEDKIVLVGATMPELQDMHPVPIRNQYGSSNMPGIEIHAHAMQSIIDGEYLYMVPGWAHLLIVFSVTLLVVFIARTVHIWRGMILIVTAFVSWIALSIYLFSEQQVIMFYLSPSFAIFTGFGGVAALNYFHEEKEKRRVTEMFSSYVSPKLVQRMLVSDEAYQLGGEEVEITALFSDIENFSTLAEQMQPELLIELINEYLEEMTNIILEEDGTLDKYIGDAVMAFYGAPAEVNDHAFKACRTAIRMQQTLHRLRPVWKNRLQELPAELLNLRVRIGINTGKMVVGNIGSTRRFSYTVLGDQVNVASRCETACKKYGVGIIATENTVKRAKENDVQNPLLFRPLDNIRVKGRLEPVRIYECIGFEKDLPEQVKKYAEIFTRGVELFRIKKWSEAAGYFSESYEIEKKMHINDRYEGTPSALYLQRCKTLQNQPPDENWDGVFEQTIDTN